MSISINVRCLILLASAVLWLRMASASTAQSPTGYQPSTPTVSPYLNLFRNNGNGRLNSPIPNYYSFVRPAERQQQYNQGQQQVLQQQTQLISQLQQNVQQLQQQAQNGPAPAQTGHDSWFMQGGTHARFLDTSGHYARAGTSGTGAR
jgi:hypothetical protein